MFFNRQTLLLTLSLLLLAAFGLLSQAAAQAQSQTQPQAVGESLSEVRILGASDQYVNLIRVSLSARAGTPVSQIDLEAERNRVLTLGAFAEVSLNIEDRGNGPILFVRVEENPPIGEVVIEGARPGYAEAVGEILSQNLIEPGVIYNTFRAQEGIGIIQQGYRGSGWPFEVPVELDVSPLTDEEIAELGLEPDGQRPVRLTYTVTENVPLDDIVFEGATVLDEEALQKFFESVKQGGTFQFDAYTAALDAVAKAYEERGYRGSGVNAATTELVDGTLRVQLQELEIVGIDTSALEVDPAALSLGVGDLFNYDLLLSDIKRLAQGSTRNIRLDYFATSSGDVRITFSTDPPDTAGPITEINIEGNTVIPTEELRSLLTLEVGDTFTSVLAEEDFRRIQDTYAERGYVLVPDPDYNYLDGTYVQRLSEVKIAGYDVVFQLEGEGEARSDDNLVTRYLPEEGTVYNREAVNRSVLEFSRLGIAQPLGFRDPVTGDTQIGHYLTPTDVADEAILTVVVQELSARSFRPELTYGTTTGFQASVSYSDRNLFGQAHDLGVSITAQTSDVGFQVGGSISYTVPWLYVDFLDFKEVPTEFSVSLFSEVATNQPLSSEGRSRLLYPGLPDIEANYVFIGEYTQRSTGLRLGVGRPIFDNTILRFSARTAYSAYYLEPPATECKFGENGNISNKSCSLPEADARPYLPQAGWSSFINAEVVFDNRDNFNFPRNGMQLTARFGVGFGSDYRNPDTDQQQAYVYEELELGFKTYIQEELFGENHPNHVLAFRLNFGHQFGNDYPSNKYFIVGNTQNIARQIRGYTREDFGPSQTYLTGSLEYRYDFGFESFATQTVIGIIWTDFGYASSVPGFPPYETALFASAGVGIQLNLGFGGIGLPPIRLDYGFSERNPAGVFGFRLGPVF